MAFRGYISLNGTELTNSSRVLSHLGRVPPTQDVGVIVGVPASSLLIENPPGSGLYLPNNETPEVLPGLYDPGVLEEVSEGLYSVVPGGADQCKLVPSVEHPGMFEMPSTATEVSPGLYSPPDGARRWGRAMLLIGDMCWQETGHCRGCDTQVSYDDSWPGLGEYLGDTIYRPELAPWHSSRQPESLEFTGVIVTNITGLGPVSVQREVEEMVGSGGAAGPHRDNARRLTFEAVLIACTNAGLEYGLNWLTCRLRETNDNMDSYLRFFHAHPEHTAAVPDTLIRDAHGVVLTKSPEIMEQFAPGAKPYQQATIYRVSWEMAVTSPYIYRPPYNLPVTWDVTTTERINWLHDVDCQLPENCVDMPVLFSATCVPERIEVVTTPPPTCGGCMPVCEVALRTFRVPLVDYPLACRETAVNLTFINLGAGELTVQAYWRKCGSDIRCEDNRWPVQVTGLPEGCTLTLDSVNSQYWAEFGGKVHWPEGIVQTPTGAPWRPVVLDRMDCWEFVVQAPTYAQFDVHMQLVDREP